ncbi:NADHdh domain containing protein, partial [Trichuris trichiura]
ILQLFRDGIILVIKSANKFYQANTILFWCIPVVRFCLLIAFWSALPFTYKTISFNPSMLFTLVPFGIKAFNIALYNSQYPIRNYTRLNHSNDILCKVITMIIFIFRSISHHQCGRTPFDLPEAERELVRGYTLNTEYGIIILLSILFSFIVVPQVVILTSSVLITRIPFLRYTLPRFRYDFLVSLM